MDPWAWFAVAFVGMAAFIFAVFMVLFRKNPATAMRVDSAKTEGGDSSPDLLLGDMTEVLSSGLPGETRDREEILPELVRAGVYGPRALAEYRALRAVLILTPLFAGTAAALVAEPRYVPYIALGGLLLAALGYSIPRLYVFMKAQARSREIERGLPIFADMVSIALLAGQGLIGALRRVTTQLRGTFPMLSEELEIVIRQTDMLNMNVAFEQWANRSQLPDVRNLALILNQAQRLGNDVTTALMEFATNLRTNARQRADAKAQRAAFWMIFPTILCLWIPAAVVLVGPVYYEFASKRAKTRDLMPNLQGPGQERFKFNKNVDQGQ